MLTSTHVHGNPCFGVGLNVGKSVGKLTDRRVATAPPGKHVDGDGLMLVVGPKGARSWIFRYQLNKKRRDMGLGRYPDVGLRRARDRVRELRGLLAEGVDPRTVKRRSIMTFEEAAGQLIDAKQAGWKNAKHRYQWTQSLEHFAYPHIGSRDVAGITIEDVLAVLQPIWQAKPETASRVRQRLEAVLDYAAVKKARTGENPARWRGNLDKLLPAPSKVRAVQHYHAIPWQDIGRVYGHLVASDTASARTLCFVILTAARSGEVRQATWQEIDLDAAVWTIPAVRMKAGKEHNIPLSAEALAVLGSPGEPDALVFPSPTGRVLSDVGLAKPLKALVNGTTVHGLRSTFRDWAGECTAHPREVIEHALAHQLKDRAEAAYARGTLFTKRRKLMDDWAAFVSKPAGEVVGLSETSVKQMS